MNRTISNSILSITVKQPGAELCSILGADGTEYLWQADPKVWGRHAPILFPIVGKLANDRYSLDGKIYELTQHGFARDMEFEVVEETADSISYRLASSPETGKKYPFEFALSVKYLLKGNTLEVNYEVSNNGEGVMPFSIGAHPGFGLNWGEGERIEEYFLEFEKAETLDAHLLGRDNLLSDRTERVLDNSNVLPLRSDMFDQDALIFLDMKSERITLRSHRHKRRVTVEFSGFPFLGIWAKPGASFVCIEPWYGHADPEESYGDIMNKPGIIKLDPGKVFSCIYRIVIEP